MGVVLRVPVGVVYTSQRRVEKPVEAILYSVICWNIDRKRDRQIGTRLATVALRYVNLALVVKVRFRGALKK